jgi:hypothetical protein
MEQSSMEERRAGFISSCSDTSTGDDRLGMADDAVQFFIVSVCEDSDVARDAIFQVVLFAGGCSKYPLLVYESLWLDDFVSLSQNISLESKTILKRVWRAYSARATVFVLELESSSSSWFFILVPELVIIQFGLSVVQFT